MTRQKTVFPTGEIAHLWANKIQDEARNSGGNFYFNKHTIYSYGYHFPIAKHIENKKGEKAILMTFRTYSNTTAKHLHEVSAAISHKNVIMCYRPDSDHEENFANFRGKIKNELSGLSTARKPEKYIEPAKRWYEHLKEYCEFFDVKIPKDITQLIESADSGKYKEYLIKEQARIKKENAAIERKRIAAIKQSVIDWQAGKEVYVLDHGTYLRVNDGNIETSKGIKIPLPVAHRVYKQYLAKVEAGGCTGNCGDWKVLEYTVSAATKDNFVIGCHNIQANEIKRIADLLNW